MHKYPAGCQQADNPLAVDCSMYRTAVETSTDGFWLVDNQGRILEVNDAYVKRSGYTREELLSMRFSDFEAIENHDEIAAHVQRIVTGGSDIFETMHRTKNGAVWHVEVNTAYLPINGGRFFAFLRDISERKQAEERRLATIELLRICNVAGSSPELIHELLSFFQEFVGCDAVGVRLKKGEDFPYYQTCGFPDDFVLAEYSLCVTDPSGKVVRDTMGHPVLECMCGNILGRRYDAQKPFFTANGSFWSGNTTELLAGTTASERQARTRNRCNAEGYESVALIPLRTQDEIFGLFQFNDKRVGLFTAEKIAFLEQSVDYVAIALAKLRSDEALRESRSLLNSIINGTSDAIYAKDLKGRYILLNAAAEKIVGKSAADAVGKDDHFLFPPAEASTVMEGDRKVIEEGVASTYEELLSDSSGMKFTFLSTKGPLYDADGKPSGLFGIARDITPRKKMEDQLDEAKELFSLFMRHSPIYAYIKEVTATGSRVLQASENFQQITGVPGSKMVGKTMAELFPAEFAAKVTADDRAVISSGEVLERREEFNGRTYTTIKFPILMRNKALLCGYSIDMTESMELEKMKDEMVSAVNHEMHTPLTAISGYLQFLLENRVDESRLQEYLGTVYKETQRLEELIECFLDLQRLRAKQKDFLFNQLPVLPLLEEVATLFATVSGKHRITVSADPGLPCILADEQSLHRVLNNLVSNAIKYSPAGGEIVVSAQSTGTFVTISVKDEGVGIPEELTQKIFDRFFRVDNSARRKSGGTGLGLALVREAVNAHGGKVWVESRPGEGSTFSISLPVA